MEEDYTDDHLQPDYTDRPSTLLGSQFSPFDSTPPNTPPLTRRGIFNDLSARLPDSPPLSPTSRDLLNKLGHTLAQTHTFDKVVGAPLHPDRATLRSQHRASLHHSRLTSLAPCDGLSGISVNDWKRLAAFEPAAAPVQNVPVNQLPATLPTFPEPGVSGLDLPLAAPQHAFSAISRYICIQGLLETHNDARWILSLPGVIGYSTQSLSHGYLLLRTDTVEQAQACLAAIDARKDHALDARGISRYALEQLQPPPSPSFFSKSEGQLTIWLAPLTSFQPSLSDLIPLLETFGSIRHLTAKHQYLLECEYWAETSAEQAFRVLHNKEISRALLTCSIRHAQHQPQRTEVPLEVSQRLDQSSDTHSCHIALHQARDVSCSSRIQRWVDDVERESHLHETPQAQEHFHSVQVATMSQPLGPVPTATAPVATEIRAPGQKPVPEYGIYREDDKIPIKNLIDLQRIEQGLDLRLTLMLKNIPNKATDQDVMRFIEEVAGRCFDVIYIRQDWRTGFNVGYGFVNFVSTRALLEFARARLGTRWNLCGSDKLCVASYANIQGKANLVAHFRNSSVLDQDETRRPKLFVTNGPFAGQPEPFPPCDDPVRKARSVANAQQFGLFPSSKPVFRVAQVLSTLNI